MEWAPNFPPQFMSERVLNIILVSQTHVSTLSPPSLPGCTTCKLFDNTQKKEKQKCANQCPPRSYKDNIESDVEGVFITVCEKCHEECAACDHRVRHPYLFFLSIPLFCTANHGGMFDKSALLLLAPRF